MQTKNSLELNFSDNMQPESLKESIRDYMLHCTFAYDCLSDIDARNVDVQISHKMKRAAGKAGKKNGKLMIRIAWNAYQKWGWSKKMESTIRHEMIHIKQAQEDHLSTGHGNNFKRLARKLDVSVNCTSFTDYKYGLFCESCGNMLGGRHKMCKTVKKPHLYNSKCCSANLYSERL